MGLNDLSNSLSNSVNTINNNINSLNNSINNNINNLNNSINNLNANIINKNGDNMNGPLNFANQMWNNVGDDVMIGDRGVAGTLFICAQQLNATTSLGIYHHNGSVNYTQLCGKDVQGNKTVFLPKESGDLAVIKHVAIAITVPGNGYYFNTIPSEILGYDFYTTNVCGGWAPWLVANVEGNSLSVRNLGSEERTTIVSIIGFKL